MARSEEALRRRAEKRGRTVEEQRQVDALADQKKQKQQVQQQETIPKDDRLQEPGAWECPTCGNHNFASRRSCHSVTCRQERPSSVPAPSPHKKQKRNHRPSSDGATDTTTSTWNIPVADASTLATNQALRQRYIETNGEGMTEEEQERAKILVARDERKRQKKLQQQKKKRDKEDASPVLSPKSVVPKQSSQQKNKNHPSSPTNTKNNSKNKTPRNLEKQALLQRYVDTGGTGMSTEEQDRAKILVARQERRAQRRQQEQLSKKQNNNPPVMTMLSLQTDEINNLINHYLLARQRLEGRNKDSRAKHRIICFRR
eukprot:scaffold4151_cov162-Amphora_coffeaeformis.AAC.10